MVKLQVDAKLKSLPDKPGVYLMKDHQGQIIYVGKAISLRSRVRSYFQNTNQGPKVKALVSKIEDIDYLITDSELEALILECNLIKKYRPRYNVNLKDDKSYPYLRVTVHEKFPRVMVTRNVKKDGSKYFGPYTQVGAVHETLRLLRSLFPLRTCRQEEVNTRQRPCLNYHINRCLAPCSGRLPSEKYSSMVEEILLFLEGKQEKLEKSITAKMNKAAEKMDFEQAAKWRDQLQAIKQVMEKQKVISNNKTDEDVIAMARGNNNCCIMVFYIRGGMLLGKNQYFLKDTDEMTRGQVLAAFIKQYYNQRDFIPPTILIETEVPEQPLLAEWLTNKRGGKVNLRAPKRGEKLKLVEMVGQNALLAIEAPAVQVEDALTQLADYLQLHEPPQRMECYDISNTQGNQSVGSMVVFVAGMPSNKDYRRFTIKTVEGPNDFASMAEVLRRRLERAQQEIEAMKQGELSLEDAKFLPLPDLIIVDGGKGQLSAARTVMSQLGFGHLATVSLAKKEEEVFVENNSDPIILPRNSAALYLIQRIRDEAHRFAITFHRQVRGKENLRSSLDQISGVGKERRKQLLKHFGSVSKIKEATLEELAAVPSITKTVAENIHNYYKFPKIASKQQEKKHKERIW